MAKIINDGKKMEIPKIFRSSVDPEKLSLTIKGIIVAIVPIFISIAGLSQIGFGSADITMLGDTIINIVDLLAKVASTIMVAWGLFRKLGVALRTINAK